MIRPVFLALAAILVPATAQAGTVAVHVVDAGGRQVNDAVVTIQAAAPGPARPIRFPWPNTMVQKNIAFNPHTLIVPVGSTVTFPNQDKVRHHVYSFSKPARFELRLFGKDESRSYTFKTPGAVALGCNIHDTMSGFIKVVDTPYANKTDGNGDTQIAGVPGGAARITVWHPRARAKNNEVTFPLDVPASGTTSKRIQILLR